MVSSIYSIMSCQIAFCFSFFEHNYMHLQHLLNWYVSLYLGQSPTHGPCTDDEYKCSNGQCIPLHYACDDYDDCGDQSDELGCREYINKEHVSNDDELKIKNMFLNLLISQYTACVPNLNDKYMISYFYFQETTSVYFTMPQQVY